MKPEKKKRKGLLDRVDAFVFGADDDEDEDELEDDDEDDDDEDGDE